MATINSYNKTLRKLREPKLSNKKLWSLLSGGLATGQLFDPG